MLSAIVELNCSLLIGLPFIPASGIDRNFGVSTYEGRQSDGTRGHTTYTVDDKRRLKLVMQMIFSFKAMEHEARQPTPHSGRRKTTEIDSANGIHLGILEF